jgi:anaerobic dimethyl sulfoxide reductase subunit C (anchor subunit)
MGRSEWQLVSFTILAQAAVGTFVVFGVTALLFPAYPFSTELLIQRVPWLVLAFLTLGVTSALLHLGQPIKSLLALSHLNQSWLSREAILGMVFGLLVAVLLVLPWIGLSGLFWLRLTIILGMLSGLALVYGISRLYMLRTVPAWNHLGTPASFFTTAFLLGGVTNTAVFIWEYHQADTLFLTFFLAVMFSRLGLMILLGIVAQMVINILSLEYLNARGGKGAESVRFLWRNRRWAFITRWSLAWVGVTLWVIAIQTLGSLNTPLGTAIMILALIFVWISEILGRTLFYAFYRREGF